MVGENSAGRIGAYLRHNLKWFFAVFFCALMLLLIMALNGIPSAEIWYGMALCLFFLAVVAAFDFYRYRRRYQTLREMEASVKVSLEELPEAAGGIEAEYQNLLHILAEENNRLANEAIRRERDMTEYYTMWVHQIKTPIAALKLLLEVGASGGDEEQQELFHIEQYVEMALSYMRLGAETTDFVIKKTDLDAVIREAVHKYARLFIHKKIKLDYKVVNKIVVTDEKWLRFVIEQLFSNAIKYTPSGSIAVYMEEEKLVIADTGIGISKEDLPRVCEKGYTGYNGHADKRSTGIGLYLCSSILKKLGHEFSITSAEGCGTRVMIGFSHPDETCYYE